jgi:hypothetical protein
LPLFSAMSTSPSRGAVRSRATGRCPHPGAGRHTPVREVRPGRVRQERPDGRAPPGRRARPRARGRGPGRTRSVRRVRRPAGPR